MHFDNGFRIFSLDVDEITPNPLKKSYIIIIFISTML